MSDFFSPLANTRPFVKVALDGWAGSGKTYTGASLAIGIAQQVGAERIAIFDTERTAAYLRRFFADHGFDPATQVLHKESRSLVDLNRAMRACSDGAAQVLLIDSLTHVYDSMIAARMSRLNRKTLRLQDWAPLKKLWAEQFAEPVVNLPLHVIYCGRATWEYDSTEEVDADTGQKKTSFVKSGVKMRAGKEDAYEADLVLHMDRRQDLDDQGRPRQWRECSVLKDRSGILDGSVLRNPTYEHFRPVIDYVLADAASAPMESANDEVLIDVQRNREEDDARHAILLENIKGEMTSAWPGQKAEEKKAKVDALVEVFGTRSWTEVEKMTTGRLEDGLARMRNYVTGGSVYGPDDDIPDFGGADAA